MNIQFPIIVLKNRDNMIYFYRDLKSLSKTSEDLLRKNVFNDVDIIDTNGLNRIILSVKKTGLRGIWGWSPLLKGKSIWVDFVFGEAKKINLEEVKAIVLKRVEKTKRFWKASWDIKDLTAAITQAQTFEELILLFK